MPRKKRDSTEVNSSSMADIAFLLLVFFLVTTTIATDKGISMILPPYSEEPPPPVEENDRNIYKIVMNSKDQILVEDEPLEIEDLETIRPEIVEHVLNPTNSDDYAESPKDAIVSIKTNRGTSYELFIDVLDEVQRAYNEIYGSRVGLTAEEFKNLDREDPEDKELYDKAREGIPRNISIAEPQRDL